MKEETLYSDKVYDGEIIHVTRDVIKLETGQEAVREIVHHPGGACIAAVTDDDQIYMVIQPRYAFNQHILELPAGKLEPNEEPIAAARRELAEEVGLGARTITPFHQIYPTVGYSNEIIHCFLAKGLYPKKEQPDFDEDITVQKMPLEAAVNMVIDGTIKDAKSAICILKLAQIKTMAKR